MALDYANALLGGQAIAGDYRQQQLQQQAAQQREQQGQWMQEDRAAEVQQRQQAQQQQQAYQQELETAMLSGNPQDVIRLMARFPQMREAITPLYEAMDEQQRRSDTTQIGSIYANAQAGNYDRAAAILEQRIAADGPNADENDRAILAGLRSQDPVQRNSAVATMGILLAATTGDDFSATYGRLNPSEATPAAQREYDWRVAQFGQEAADQWLAQEDTTLVTPEPGGSVYNKADFVVPQGGPAPTAQGGGDPTSSGGPSLTIDQFNANREAMGDARAAQFTVGSNLPVRVSSPQQARTLPSGTLILLPDGTTGRVP